MDQKRKIMIALLVSALVFLACNFPLSAIKINPAALQTPGTTALPAATPAPPDYSQARLTTADLPEGFRELTAEELAALGLSPNLFTDPFAGMLSKAKPLNFAAFTNTNGRLEVIASILVEPLTTLERGAVDLFLKDPQRLINDFSGISNLADLKVDESAKPVGDSSGSVLFAIKDSALKMTGSLTASRHGEVLQVALLFYPEGTQPTLTSYAVAQIVDAKLSAIK